MLDAEKLTTKVDKDPAKIYPHNCPICNISTNYVYRIEDPKTHVGVTYYRCQCGVLFQDEFASNDVYNTEFIEVGNLKKSVDRNTHAARTYIPLIEELTFGRTMLDVGFGIPYNMKYFEDRGWITWGIECNNTIKPGGNIYLGDFMTYDFSPHIASEELKKQIGEKEVKRTFDLIWMAHVLEHFNQPLEALERAYDLLAPNGVIYIGTPDIEFINKTGVAGFPHWRKQEHYIMWSERALKRELERLGFKVIMMRRNFSSRFSAWYDLHCVCQKLYF